jgi:hypothetical protein
MLLDRVKKKDGNLLKIIIYNNKKKISLVIRKRGYIDKKYYFKLASKT